MRHPLACRQGANAVLLDEIPEGDADLAKQERFFTDVFDSAILYEGEAPLPPPTSVAPPPLAVLPAGSPLDLRLEVDVGRIAPRKGP